MPKRPKSFQRTPQPGRAPKVHESAPARDHCDLCRRALGELERGWVQDPNAPAETCPECERPLHVIHRPELELAVERPTRPPPPGRVELAGELEPEEPKKKTPPPKPPKRGR